MILEKLRKSIMSEKIESKVVEELAKNVDNPADKIGLPKKCQRISIVFSWQTFFIILRLR